MRNMKSIGLTLVLALALGAVACAKPPQQELDAATKAIADATTAKANIYAKDALASAQTALDEGKAEIEVQKQKWFANYDKVKEKLAAAKSGAEAAATQSVANMETAKNEANTAIADAKTAIDTAGATLANAPKGKGTKADIEQYTADLEAARASVADAESKLASEDYYGARDAAAAARDKANQINSDIQAVIDKVKGKHN